MIGDPMLDVEPTPHTRATDRPRWSVATSAAIVILGVAAIAFVGFRTPTAHDAATTPAADTPDAAGATADDSGALVAERDDAPERGASSGGQSTQGDAVEALADAPAGAEAPDAAPVATEDSPDTQASASSDASKATPIRFMALDGSPLQIPGERPTVVYFMSTTGCVSCEVGAGQLQKVHAQDLGLDVIALEMIPGTSADWMTEYQQFLGLDYPVVEDPDGAVGVRYDIAALSMAIVIDATGHQTSELFDPADHSALDRALATVGVVAEPASVADTQPPKLLP